MKKHTLFLLALLFLNPLPSFFAQVKKDYFPPPNSWERRAPAESGFSLDKLNEAVEFAMTNEYTGSRDLRIAILESFAREPYHEILGPTRKRGGPAGLILKNGYIIAEWGDIDRVDMTFSVTKSYLSTIAGLALDKGLIRNVRDKVVDYVWDNTFDGEHNSTITWDNLLDQSSDWCGELFGMADWGDRPPNEGGIDDWKLRTLQTPGTTFEYNDVRVNVLAYALLQVMRKPLPQILKSEIMDPVGASTTWRWHGYNNTWVNVDGVMVQSVSGGGHNGGGLFINTYDQARYGLLFSKNGKWNGKQLISENWVKMVQQSSRANESYGYMWWLNKGPRNWQGVPDTAFYASGFGGNFIVVLQELDMVIVTRWLQPSKIGEMVRKVLEAAN